MKVEKKEFSNGWAPCVICACIEWPHSSAIADTL
jgi:hypothetical protein